jgi:8-oxo-dGTP pyrophosphatase MutT (NUDIX family)
VAGCDGGAEGDESPQETPRREMHEEAEIPSTLPLIRLDSVASITVSFFRDRDLWGPDICVVPQHAFGVELRDHTIVHSDEHAECRWVSYAEAERLL